MAYDSDLRQEYQTWVLAQELEGCTLVDGGADTVLIEGDLVTGGVSFYEMDGACIVELRLDCVVDGELAFFLHFDLEDLGRAQGLFDEMALAIRDMAQREVRRVLLCCSSGMTTAFFGAKLNESAGALGAGFEFTAKPVEEALRVGTRYAAVLVAPQVGYRRKELVEALPSTPVIELPGKMFGAYDALAVLRLLSDVLSGGHAVNADARMRVVRDYDRTHRFLSLSYIHREDEPTLAYRVLDRGEVALTGMLVRRSFDMQTLDDLAATLRVKGWKTSEFDAVGIAVQDLVDEGVLVHERDDEEVREDLRLELERAWGTRVYVDHNATAAAVGCYMAQDTYENVAFHAQTVGVPGGEEGYVIEGRPLAGRRGRSGHLDALVRNLSLDMDLEDAAWRVDGMRKLVGRCLTALACTIAPEVIYVWCDLLPDMDELRKEMAKALPEYAIPKLVEVVDYDDCVLTGELTLCMNRLAESERAR